jgi:hypothetical protein
MTPATFLSCRYDRQAKTQRRLRGGPIRVAVVVALALTSGCAVLQDGEQIIRVNTSRNPTEAARLTLVGIKALDNGEIERAADRFRSALHADETYGPAHNSLGLMYFEDGDLFQAILEFERAMELMPQDPAVYYNLGLTLETAGKVFEAMDLYIQAVEMDPTDPIYLGNLVRLRVRLGEFDPTLVTQLQDLILIETRPDWRRWADQQLSLTFNPTLDRGPDPPEFDTGGGDDRDIDDDAYLKSKIIELSPVTNNSVDRRPLRSSPSMIPRSFPGTNSPLQKESLRAPSDTIEQSDRQTLPAPNETQRVIPPATIRDNGSLNSLPPSIRRVPDEIGLPAESDR